MLKSIASSELEFIFRGMNLLEIIYLPLTPVENVRW